MRFSANDKFIAFLTLLSGLTISAVAIYYSVAGLVAIFAAAVVPIIVMGVVLEISKLVATVWLKLNWNRAPWFIKTYLLTAITVLMVITSMGIFGFLSKAHSDQTLVSGDVGAKIAIIDEKIKIERENIANAQSVIKQMDSAVNGIMATGDQEVKLRDGSTRINSAAERSLQVRRSQAKDRAKLTKEIEDAQSRIIKLQEEAAPIRAEVRKVEAEVGPIKYIAALIYGDNPDTNLLERAVRIVIIVIVAVFDPLAVILLLSSQYSFQWFREEKERLAQEAIATPKIEEPKVEEPVEKTEPVLAEEPPKQNWEFPKHANIAEHNVDESDESDEALVEELTDPSDIEKWNKMIEEAEKEAEKEKAKRKWKEEHPQSNLKAVKKLHDKGIIEQLPWEQEQNTPVEEIAKTYQIIPELEEQIKKDTTERIKPDLTEVIEPDGSKKKTAYMIKDHNKQVKKLKDQ